MAADGAGAGAALVVEEFPIEKRSLKALALLSLKRTYDLFHSSHWESIPLDEASQKVKISCKVSVKEGMDACIGGPALLVAGHSVRDGRISVTSVP